METRPHVKRENDEKSIFRATLQTYYYLLLDQLAMHLVTCWTCSLAPSLPANHIPDCYFSLAVLAGTCPSLPVRALLPYLWCQRSYLPPLRGMGHALCPLHL